MNSFCNFISESLNVSLTTEFDWKIDLNKWCLYVLTWYWLLDDIKVLIRAYIKWEVNLDLNQDHHNSRRTSLQASRDVRPSCGGLGSSPICVLIKWPLSKFWFDLKLVVNASFVWCKNLNKEYLMIFAIFFFSLDQSISAQFSVKVCGALLWLNDLQIFVFSWLVNI